MDEVRFYAFSTANRTSGFSAAAIDNVRVLAVPEPQTWAMLMGGLALIGWRRRANRR
ncbi:PEP-CTERM sorting domain-containing protein [Duganella sp. FT27W]|nr:PEP-CTERM sorting domain-containing protein [Duganella sp. FT27W]